MDIDVIQISPIRKGGELVGYLWVELVAPRTR